MSLTREQVLSDFIDAWNAGKRPDVDEYVARVPVDEQAALGEELAQFLTFAPTPEFSDEALTAIRAEVDALSETERGLFGSLLGRLRSRVGLTSTAVATELASDLGLEAEQVPKTAAYLERLEDGSLEPARVSRRVFEALGRLFGVGVSELEGAANRSGWNPMPKLSLHVEPEPVFRADEDAADRTGRHLEVLADALAAPSSSERDKVDDLFLGGR